MSQSNKNTEDRRSFMPWWATVFGQAKISKTDESDDPSDVLDMAGDGKQCNPMPRWEPYGLLYNPPARTDSVYFKVSDGGISLPWGTSYQGRPKTTKAGDVSLYVDVTGIRLFLHGSQSTTPGQVEVLGKSGSKIVLDPNGKITITAAAGQDIVLNGGTLQVARRTDPVLSTADFQTWATAVKAQIIAAGGGDVGAAPTTIGTINNGATNVKG